MCYLNNEEDKKKPPVNYEHTARLRIVKDVKEQKDGKKPRVNDLKEKKSIKEDASVTASRKPMKMSSIYRKKYTLLAVIVCAVFILAYQFIKVKDVDFAALRSNISKNIDTSELYIGNEQDLRKLYGINQNEIENYVSFAPKSNMDANEILVVKCNSEYSDIVMKKVQGRVDSQSNSFKNYAPDQYKIISSSELKKKGDYIYFVSAKDVNAVDNIIKKSYK
ncbi:DUF4358 domain-containing protein [Peptostreptococcus russellii]|uniref:DUF4358 domain-containing protein n=1 Tax=Peptostreptococcus russellii TaxID=215200 RepID=UPI001FA84B14